MSESETEGESEPAHVRGDDNSDARYETEDVDGRHVVYVLECADGSLYTGYTTDLERRVDEHNAGDGAKYTRGRTPVAVVHRERYESRSAAMSREYEIKQFSRSRKVRLVGLEDAGGDGEKE